MILLSRSRATRAALLPVLALASLALAGLAAPAAHAQTSYNVLFDGTFNGSVTPPLTGAGVFNFTNDLGLGTFGYNALGPVTFTFTVNGETYTQSDIVSDTSLTTVVFTAAGNGRRLRFSDTGNGGGGPFSGSLDLFNSNQAVLSFEPSYFGGDLNLYLATGGDGNYIALSDGAVAAIPEPSEYAAMGMAGFALCGLMVRARRRKSNDIGKDASVAA